MNVFFDLQEGFYDDEVSIFAGENKIFHAEQVKTRMQIGLAASFEIELQGDAAEFRIEIPTRDINERKEIPLTEKLHIAVSLTDDGKLKWKVSDTPFLYM